MAVQSDKPIIYSINGKRLLSELAGAVFDISSSHINECDVYYIGLQGYSSEFIRSTLATVYTGVYNSGPCPEDTITVPRPGKPPVTYTFFRISYTLHTTANYGALDTCEFGKAGAISQEVFKLADARQAISQGMLVEFKAGRLRIMPGEKSNEGVTTMKR